MFREERFCEQNYETNPHNPSSPNPFAKKENKDINDIKRILNQELAATNIYKEAWEKAKNGKFKNLSPELIKPGTPDECYIAVIAYTLENPELYRDFNAMFRNLTDENSWKCFPFKSLFFLLKMSRSGIDNVPPINRTLYRKIPGYHFDADDVRSLRPGGIFYFHQCASTTANPEKAHVSNGTRIIIRNGAKVAIGIQNYSYFPDEQEVLVFPENKFKVINFERKGLVHTLTIEQ